MSEELGRVVKEEGCVERESCHREKGREAAASNWAGVVYCPPESES